MDSYNYSSVVGSSFALSLASSAEAFA